MKAILVMGMPDRCGECPLCIFGRNHFFYCGRTAKKVDKDKKSENCPLKPMPQHKEINFDDCMEIHNLKVGYNHCIDEILGETE